MKKRNLVSLSLSVGFFAAFLVLTLLLKTVDVEAAGQEGTSIGLATLNTCFHNLTGVNMTLYVITDWMGLVPIGVCFFFAIFGFIQLIKRKNILKVDKDILLLGAFYIAVISFYLLFEFWVINYRPVLIDGVLEASYPSSTTMLVACVMPTAAMQLGGRIKNRGLRTMVVVLIVIFTAFMVVGRLISGVHWFSDIVGGALLSVALVSGYCYFS